MKSDMGEETQNTREDVFADYLIYYQQVWSQGNFTLCQETEVAEKAKRFLLTESNPDSRFLVFDFYRTVLECLTEGRRECQDVLKELVKATEFLEMLCVNLFLFPWKKEIKTLKTFTGPFVYWIKSVLPQSMVKGILESIGYHPETDMEYRLEKSADTQKATQMGFDLFLARLECEYLLEVMGQHRPCECLEILQQRSPQAPLSLCEANEGVREEMGEESAPAGRANASLQVNVEEDELDRGCSLVDPGSVLPEECQTAAGTVGGGDEDPEQYPQSLAYQPLDKTVEPGVDQSHGFLTDDRSILEMRKHYPDLAIRQKPIFGEPQGQPGGLSRQKAGRRTPKESAVAISCSSTPPSAARLSESCPVTNVTGVSPKLKRHPPDTHAQERDLAETETHHTQSPALQQGAGPRGVQTILENNQACMDESIVSELAERMGQMSMKDYRAVMDLKYPVEETAWQDGRHRHEDGKTTPLSSPKDKAQPIMCHPSQVQHCSIVGCRSCDRSSAHGGDSLACDGIKEPPQSFYIPPSTLNAPCPSRGHAPPPVDELLKTYVLVEHDRKEL